MWIRISDSTVFNSRAELSAAYPNISFPKIINSVNLEYLELYPYEKTAAPTFNNLTHYLVEEDPILISGIWTQQWSVAAYSAEDLAIRIENKRKTIWERIKEIRDRKTQEGGYTTNSKWFHSDTFSRTQQIGLVMMGANIPANLQWKTMDGTFITMTPTLAGEVFAAAAAQDTALFTHAETLKYQVDNAADPATVDITAGWPTVYTE